jgi:hypothetical protein
MTQALRVNTLEGVMEVSGKRNKESRRQESGVRRKR